MPFEIADPEIDTLLRGCRLKEIYASEETIYAMRLDLTLVLNNSIGIETE